jgi:hypothetical protein
MQFDMFATDEPAAPVDRRAEVIARQPENIRQQAPTRPRENFLFMVGAIERVDLCRPFFETLAREALLKVGGMEGGW